MFWPRLSFVKEGSVLLINQWITSHLKVVTIAVNRRTCSNSLIHGKWTAQAPCLEE